MEAKNRNITWLQSTNQTEITPRYQSLDSRERGKRRLRGQLPLERIPIPPSRSGLGNGRLKPALTRFKASCRSAEPPSFYAMREGVHAVLRQSPGASSGGKQSGFPVGRANLGAHGCSVDIDKDDKSRLPG